jgi:DNA mismatch repair protein MutL
MAIQILDQNTINKIAAGEVIDRPSSVVKELMENAIDAKATAITVEIKDGGISFIRITDNGCGIEKKEIPMAFLRHSTSKIRSAEDLLTVSSLGFRGEALSSIAAVAQVELITKTPDSLTACRYVIEGGKEHSVEEVGAPDGTTFIVRNLFFNTPARRKFLKSAMTEAGYINELVERIALSHPDISIRFINNNQNKLHTSGNGNIKDILYHVYGRDIAGNLLEVAQTSEALVTITGFIGKPIVSRGNRNFENYFINGRFIKSNIINKAIEDAYKPYMMQHRYPFTALHFSIDQSMIDVNVHPSKMELRIQNSEEVYRYILDILTKVLAHKEYIPKADDETKKTPLEAQPPKPQVRPAEPFEKVRIAKEEAVQAAAQSAALRQIEQPKVPVTRTQTPPVVRETDSYQATLEKKAEPPAQMSLFDEEQTGLLDLKNVQSHKIIGQLFATYWLVEFDDKLFIIDQHAAHEKVLYERFMERLKKNEMASQNIMPPFVISLSLAEENVLNEHMETFLEMGFVIEHFGGREYAVSAVPAELYGMNEKDLFTQVLDELVTSGIRSNDSVKDRIATMACKAAVKAHDRLSVAEAKALIDQLLLLENPYNCPHGRPTIIQMSRYEIEKKFKRIV